MLKCLIGNSLAVVRTHTYTIAQMHTMLRSKQRTIAIYNKNMAAKSLRYNTPWYATPFKIFSLSIFTKCNALAFKFAVNSYVI